MKNKIDKRLLDIASLIEPCDLIADIGSDHGYLPIYLIKNNVAKKAIASDVAILPLARAKENIKENKLEDKIEAILTNGLKNIPLSNYVIMAGMGANLIIDILKENKVNHDYFILEPNLNAHLLREYLTQNNYKIIDEVISFQKNKYYEIIKACKGNEILNEEEIIFGPINIKKRSENFLNKWNELLNTYQKIVSNFKGNDKELEKIQKKIDLINKVLKKS